MAKSVDVFVAHAGTQGSVASAVQHALGATGRNAFVFEESLSPDTHFSTTDRILNVDRPLVVLLASAEAAASQWVRHEVDVATNCGLDRVVVYCDLDPGALDPTVAAALHLAGESGVEVHGDPTPDQLERIVAQVDAVRPATPARPGVFGREEDARRLLDRLDNPDRPLVNLHGAPLTGKSTLAHWVRDVAIADGAFAAAASVALQRPGQGPDELATLVASALDLDTSTRSSTGVADVVAVELGRVGSLLLLVESLELATEATEAVLLHWVQQVPGLRILTTSTRPFAERDPLISEYPLGPLSLPTSEIDIAAPEELIGESAAVQLFLSLLPEPDGSKVPPAVGRAQAGDPETIRDIARLCVGLGGFPGPIKLASEPFLRKGDLGTLIARNHRFLQQRSGSADDRRYLFAAIATQLELIPAAARLAFFQCAQFTGPIGEEAGDAILDPLDSDLYPDELLDTLSRYHLLEYEDLGDQSPEAETTTARYWMSAPMARYGRSAWEDEVDADTRQRHVEAFVDHFASLCAAALDEGHDDHAAAREAVDIDRSNVLAAVELMAPDDPRVPTVVLAASAPLLLHGPQDRLRDLVASTLPAAKDQPRIAAELQVVDAEAAWVQGHYEEAVDLARAAVEVAAPLDDDRIEARALRALGRHLIYTARPDEALESLRRAADRLESRPDQLEELVVTLLTLVGPLEVMAEVDEAQSIVDRVRAIGADLLPETHYQRGRIENAQGLLLWHDGRPGEALEAFRRGEEIFESSGSEVWQAGSLTNQAFCLIDLGEEHLDEAQRLCESAHVRHVHAENFGWALVNRSAWAKCHLFAGRYDEALEMVEHIAGDPLSSEYTENLGLAACTKAEVLVALGADDATDALHAAIEAVEAAGGRRHLRRFRVGVALAERLAAAGDRDGAREQLSTLKDVIAARRITKDHQVWHIREAYSRYAHLRLDVEDL